ncbi:molybdenum cofactor guanylyltransferase [Luminiphilus sp.]|nr:molybdenum cofactor guanylyltransferase [Luminiphilus sp.]
MTASLIEINSVAILSGGESRRMGVDKAMLLVDDLPLIEKQVRNVRQAFGDIPLWMCSGPRRYPTIDHYNVTYLNDALPAGGPLVGIAQALHWASPEDGDEGHVLVIPCDTLIAPDEIYKALSWVPPKPEGVVFLQGQRAHPLHGIYSTALADAASAYLAKGGRSVMGFLDEVAVRRVSTPPGWESCLNVNSKRDFQAALEAFLKLTEI